MVGGGGSSGDGASVTGGVSGAGGDVGSLVVGGGVSVAGGEEGSSVLDGDAGSLTVCEGGEPFEVGEGSPEEGVTVLGLVRIAGTSAAGLALAERLVD